jgi:tetratricopeptide (TPR) repeat protein
VRRVERNEARTRGWLLVGAVVLASCGPGAAERAQEHLKNGTALVAEGRYEAAVGELGKAVELNRDSIDAYTQLGNAHRGLKQYDKAFEAYRAAKKIDRYVTRPHIENARALVETGQIEAAIDELNHVIELDPKDRETMVLLGQVSMMPRPLPGGGTGVPKESLERALLNLETVVRVTPDHLQAHYLLAQAREKAALKDQAREAWSKVHELASGKSDQARIAAEATAALERLKR